MTRLISKTAKMPVMAMTMPAQVLHRAANVRQKLRRTKYFSRWFSKFPGILRSVELQEASVVTLLLSVLFSVQRESLAPRDSVRVEAEAMKVVSAFGGTTQIQDMAPFKGRWGGGKQLLWMVQDKAFNSRLVLSFNLAIDGEYTPVVYFTQAPDYGMFRFFWGNRGMALINGFAQEVFSSRFELPAINISKGENTIKVDAYNYDERSKARKLFVGLDRIEFIPTRGLTRGFATGGICPADGGKHLADSTASITLESLPYGMWTMKWCYGCGGVFNRHVGKQFGGSCHVNTKQMGQFGYYHGGNLCPDRVVAFAIPGIPGPKFHWCANCKAIYREGIQPPAGTDGCAFGNSPNDRVHIPYKNDEFALRKTGPEGRYRVCLRCGLLYSRKDMGQNLWDSNSEIDSDCVTFYPGKGPHEPAPNEFYDLVEDPKATFSSFREFMWAKCIKCKTLYCMDHVPGNEGRCAAGGTHSPEQFHMYPLIQDPVNGTEDWILCNKCDSLFYAGSNSKAGKCPGGGEHELPVPYLPGDLYRVKLKSATPGGEAGFYRCSKCEALFSSR